MEYHEQITKASVERLIELLKDIDTDPGTVAYALIFLGDRIGKSISPATHEELVGGVFADAVDTLILRLGRVKETAGTKW